MRTERDRYLREQAELQRRIATRRRLAATKSNPYIDVMYVKQSTKKFSRSIEQQQRYRGSSEHTTLVK